MININEAEFLFKKDRINIKENIIQIQLIHQNEHNNINNLELFVLTKNNLSFIMITKLESASVLEIDCESQSLFFSIGKEFTIFHSFSNKKQSLVVIKNGDNEIINEYKLKNNFIIDSFLYEGFIFF